MGDAARPERKGRERTEEGAGICKVSKEGDGGGSERASAAMGRRRDGMREMDRCVFAVPMGGGVAGSHSGGGGGQCLFSSVIRSLYGVTAGDRHTRMQREYAGLLQ